MTTSIYNPRNGYTIGMSYTVIDEDTLQCVFTGDADRHCVNEKRINEKNNSMAIRWRYQRSW
jgi:hypothetical protein